MRDRIESLLALANGKRRTRTLDYDDIARLLAETLADGTATTGGGTVANTYGYQSSQTVACAAKHGDKVYLAISTKSASKGTSQIPRSVPHITKNLHKWDGIGADLTLSLAETRLLVRRWRRERGEFVNLPKAYWDIPITREDSAAVGNCEAYTERVAAGIGGFEATAKQVFDYVKSHHPDQLPRAVLAIKHAARKATVMA